MKVLSGVTAALIGVCLSFTAAARPSEEQVRRFDHLCRRQDSAGRTDVYARFLPTTLDYYTRLTPSAPVTKGEHIRDMLILTPRQIEGLITAFDKAGTANPFVVEQKQEMEKARAAFLALDRKTHEALPSCAAPFPAP